MSANVFKTIVSWTLLCERLAIVIFVVSMADLLFSITAYPRPIRDDNDIDDIDETDAPRHVTENT
jgi:hypothetical protein